MIANILEIISRWIISVIDTLGYFGVALLMAIESACIPLPSEIIMPFSGYLVSVGRFNIYLVTLMGAVGSVFGSLLAYYVGKSRGRKFIEKYGRYILISRHDLDLADRFFLKYGAAATFFGRMMPVVRTFISLPAGIARLEIKKFILFTFLGSLPWSYALALVGVKLGENWPKIRIYFHRFDYAIFIILILSLVWYVCRHLKNQKKHEE